MEKTEVSSIDRPFLSLASAAIYLGLKKSTLYSYCNRRMIRFYKINSRLNYFLKEDLDEFILNENNLVKSESQIKEEASEQILHNEIGGGK
jgi:hypothetical protein